MSQAGVLSSRGLLYRFLLVTVDLVIAGTVAATRWLPLIAERPFGIMSVLGYGLAAFMVVGVVLRWRHPVIAPISVAAVTLAGLMVGVASDPMLATAWALYPLALQRGFRRGWIRLSLFLLVFLLAALFASSNLSQPVLMSLTAIAALTCSWTLGSAVGDRAATAAEAARERVAHALVEQRLEVAREVHDVVAHTLGTIGVEAAVAAHVDTLSEDELRAQLVDISDTSRRALGQVKGLLVTLRKDATGRTEAAPTIADLHSVLERARAAGLNVDATISDVVALSNVEQLTVFRIIQEAVTNVIRHAPRSTCHVSIFRAGDWLILNVTNSNASAARSTVSGNGLRGVRERVSAVGGSCVIETTPAGEFRVYAELPYFSTEGNPDGQVRR